MWVLTECYMSFSQPDSLLRINTVLALVAVSHATWYRGVANGSYPASVRIGKRAVAWRSSEIQKLIQTGVFA